MISTSGVGTAFLSGKYQQSNAGAVNLTGLSAAAISITVIFAALYAVAGWGLLKLRSWGRILTIVLLVIGVAFELLQWTLSLRFTPSSFLEIAVTLLLYGITIRYLVKTGVKAAFPSS
ncbi:MAG TPA: hypothetical protein VJA94_09360 [Candidatus Angelobacter sp.]